MKLTDEQVGFIRKSTRLLSPRQMAKKLGVERSVVEEFLNTSKNAPLSASACHSRLSQLPSVVLIILLSILTFVTYSNTIHYDFIWDDTLQITENPVVKEPLSLKSVREIFSMPVGVIKDNPLYKSSSYRPITTLINQLNYARFKDDPAGYHLTNILLHAAAAALLFILMKGLLGGKDLAFWIAALFAVHPLQIAGVTYISGRAEPVTSIFMFASFLLFVRALGRPGAYPALLAAAAFCFLGALFTKEISAVLPLVFLLYLYAYKPKRPKRFDSVFGILFVGAFLGYFLVRLRVLGQIGQGGVGDLSFSVILPAAFMVLTYYAKLLVFPLGLHMNYQLPLPDFGRPEVIGGMVLSGLFLWAMVRLRRDRELFFGLGWFLIFLVPVLNLLILLNGPMAEHWLYNACIGIFIAATVMVLRGSGRPAAIHKYRELFMACLVVYFAVVTYRANPVWKSEISMFENILKYTHYDYYIYNNLGSAYARRGRLDEAERMCRKSLELDPEHRVARENLATIQRQKKDMAGARANRPGG